jgi:divalent metal cation (Fe/Co/Zn/Cd) transporter
VDRKAGERTLLASVLLSSPGPIVLGIGLFFGRASTQLADFVRRTAELLAVVVSWAVFRILRKGGRVGEARKEKLERLAGLSVGGAMCLSGAAMLFIPILSRSTEKGNVAFGLVISFLGAVTNTWFALRYHKLNRQSPDPILAAQRKLYFAKTLVDVCVTGALAVVAFAPGLPAANFVDLGGTLVVAVYLIASGIAAVRSCGEKSLERAGLGSRR